MSIEETAHRLRLFGIPDVEASGNVDAVRKVLARLVEEESLSLFDLQTARDIVRRAADVPAEAYLFLAAMFLSVRDGNILLRSAKGPNLLKKGGHLDEDGEGGDTNAQFSDIVDMMWPDAVAAAESLVGEIVQKCCDSGGDCWIFQRNANAVDAVSKGISALASRSGDTKPLSSEELAQAIAFREFELNERQQLAVKMAAERLFTVITGGPGTGKTTIVFSILRALISRGLSTEDIALAAPTGRAAQRMGESLRKQCADANGLDDATRTQIEALKGTTIHTLLGGYPPNWKYSAENRLPLKLVVVDESSMVDVMLMRALIAALPDDCRLVLLGDKDQLPSVDAGAVLGDIIEKGSTSCVVHLVEAKRFSGDLADCAAAIRNERFDDAFAKITCIPQGRDDWLAQMESADKETNCFHLLLEGNDRGKRDACHKAVLQWAEHFGLLTAQGELVKLASDPGWKDDSALKDETLSERSDKLFKTLVRSQVLTVVRRGTYGVQKINDLLITKRFGGQTPRNPLSRPGVPVIVTRNTPVRNLWNGDIGVTVKGEDGTVVLFPRGDKVVSCPIALLPEHELAYAITIHKSQGSEFGNVLVVLPVDVNHPLLSRQLVYTGITRAKERAVILGTEDALKAAIANEIKRDTGIVL